MGEFCYTGTHIGEYNLWDSVGHMNVTHERSGGTG